MDTLDGAERCPGCGGVAQEVAPAVREHAGAFEKAASKAAFLIRLSRWTTRSPRLLGLASPPRSTCQDSQVFGRLLGVAVTMQFRVQIDGADRKPL